LNFLWASAFFHIITCVEFQIFFTEKNKSMRIQIVALVLLILFSCKKEKLELGEDFDRIVGNWESINGNDKTFISIEENGKVKVERSTERGQRFRIEETEENNFLKPQIGNNWTAIICNNSKSYDQIIYFHKNKKSDTIIFWIGDYIHGDTLLNQDQFFVRDQN
jgi:hypothetical protein